jgi:Carboxypeptidase regulatory-like domain
MRRNLIVVVVVGALAALLAFWLWHRGGSAPPATTAATPGAATSGGPVVPAGPAAPARAAVIGHVADAAAKPIAGATVLLAPADDDGTGDPVTAVTGADGAYAADLAPGRWLASASAPGHLPRAGGEVQLAPGDRRTLDFALDGGGRPLTGTVTDASNAAGGPIAGVLVEAAPERGALGGEGPDVAATLTDAQGHYALAVREGRYRVRASHGDYVGDSGVAEVGPDGATLDFALVPGGAIEGVVEDAATGQPVAGARVSVARQALAGGPGGAMASARDRRRVLADGAGTFRVGGLEPGAIEISATAPGRASDAPTVVPLGVAEQVSGIVVYVATAPRITGVVLDEAGKPVAGATAIAVGLGSGWAGTAVTDDQGAFAFEGVKPGRFMLSAGGEHWLGSEPVMVMVRGAGIDGVKLTVRAGRAIRGHVDPPAVADVEIARDPGKIGLDLGALMIGGTSTEAGADGAFTLAPVEEGETTLTARATDGRRGTAKVTVGPDGASGVVIHLRERATLAGRVTDGKDPVAGAIVSARRVEGGSRTAVIVNGVDVATDRAPTGPDGRFALVGLDAGRYELQVLDGRGTTYTWRSPADKDRPAAPIAVSLTADQHKTGVELEVERPHGVIRGVVVGPDGRPVRDAWVSASRGFDDLLSGLPGAGSGAGSGSGEPRSESRTMVVKTDDEGGDLGGIFGGVPPVLTDADGRFELAHLRRGTYQVIAEGNKGRARGTVAKVEPDADVTVHLAALTELAGTVTTGGKPAGDFTITLQGTANRSQRFVAADGHFVMARVDPGDYDVVATGPDGDGRAHVKVVEGQRAEVTLTLVGHGRVTGKVVDAAGKPVAGAPVLTTAMQPGGRMTISMEGMPEATGPDGSFAIASEPGKRLLIVLGGQGPVATRPIEVTSGETTDVGTLTAAPGK